MGTKYSQLVILSLLIITCHQESKTEHYNLLISVQPFGGEFLNERTEGVLIWLTAGFREI